MSQDPSVQEQRRFHFGEKKYQFYFFIFIYIKKS